MILNALREGVGVAISMISCTITAADVLVPGALGYVGYVGGGAGRCGGGLGGGVGG